MTSQKLFCLLAAAFLTVPATSTAQDLRSDINTINQRLASEGLMIAAVEWITAGDADEAGQAVYFNNRGNKQLSSDFVPNDPRRGGFDDITYIVDMAEGATATGLSPAETQASIDNAMSTWNGVNCSAIPITSFGGVNIDLGYVQFLYGFGGVQGYAADLTHAGWLPKAFFDFIAPDGGSSILGVTYTFVFVNGGGVATDIDNNGRSDVAFREIYYNDNFAWTNDGGGVDVETVVLHESGHGLSQAHFGKLFKTNKNGKFHFAPRAVMNAGYTGEQREIRKTDKAGHCSNWAAWPEE